MTTWMKAFCFLKIQLLARIALPTFSSPYSLHQKNIWSALLAHRARDVWHKWRTNTCQIQSHVTQWTPPPFKHSFKPEWLLLFPLPSGCLAPVPAPTPGIHSFMHSTDTDFKTYGYHAGSRPLLLHNQLFFRSTNPFIICQREKQSPNPFLLETKYF